MHEVGAGVAGTDNMPLLVSVGLIIELGIADEGGAAMPTRSVELEEATESSATKPARLSDESEVKTIIMLGPTDCTSGGMVLPERDASRPGSDVTGPSYIRRTS